MPRRLPMTAHRPSLDTLLAELLTLDAVVAACPLLDLDALLASVDVDVSLSPCTVARVAPSAPSPRPQTAKRRRRRRT